MEYKMEKTMTFTVTDALMSPMGLYTLTGAGFKTASTDNVAHVHITKQVAVKDNKAVITLEDLQDETGLNLQETFYVCKSDKVPAFGAVVDSTGYAIKPITGALTITGTAATDTSLIVVEDGKNATFAVTEADGTIVELDFYIAMPSGVTEITVAPEDFGGYFYVEAQTLYRRQDTGKDMAAEVIIPKAKVQSGFTISMGASGDPSTFDFTMDAFPAYTKFDRTKKVLCAIQIVGVDAAAGAEATEHTHTF